MTANFEIVTIKEEPDLTTNESTAQSFKKVLCIIFLTTLS